MLRSQWRKRESLRGEAVIGGTNPVSGGSEQKIGSKALNGSGESFMATTLYSIMSKSLGSIVRWSGFDQDGMTLGIT